MAEPIVLYVHDHFTGARFAISLLEDLSKQGTDPSVALLANRLLPEIEQDRSTLEGFLKQLGDDASVLKEFVGWVAQKAGRSKLSMHEPFGLFEAVEMLSLGVLGKLALWNALKSLGKPNATQEEINFEQLISRAHDQHQQLESVRLALAVRVLRSSNVN